MVFLCQFIHIDAPSPRSSQFLVANHDVLNLVGSDREFHQNSFWYISSARCGPRNAVSVPQFCHAEHHEVAASWWCSAGLRKHPVAIGWKNLAGFAFNQEMYTSAIDHSLIPIKEGIQSTALLELFRITRITLHCPFHESSLSICHWMGCRRYFAASRLKVLLDEDDSRSSSRVREHGSFLLVSQLHVATQTFWSQCIFPRSVWTNRWIVHFQRVSPFLIWSASTFSSASSSWSKRSTDTGTQLFTGLPVLTIGFLVFVWVCWESSLPPATSEPNSFLQLSSKEIFGGGRGDAYSFSYVISPVSIMIAIGIQ